MIISVAKGKEYKYHQETIYTLSLIPYPVKY